MKRCKPIILGILLAARGTQAFGQTISPTLQSVAFGSVAITADLVSRQNSCSFTGVNPVIYSITASGNGPGSSFAMTNGTSILPYEVQWAQSANASTGTNLVAGQALTGQQTQAILSGLTCALGITNATLIVTVRSGALQQATTGSYTGSLTILLSPQ